MTRSDDARLRLYRFLFLAVLIISTGLPAHAGQSRSELSSNNVEYLGTVPFDAGYAVGARLVDTYLYVTTQRNFSIYDVSDPLVPIPVSTTPFEFKCCNEDVATDGRILLFSETFPNTALHVWDVSNKLVPTKIAELPVDGEGEHTVTCILRCTWAYGSAGAIFDLRDPSQPRVAGRWTDATTPQTHDFEEVRRGFLVNSPLTPGVPIELLDVRDPRRPKVIMRHSRTELGMDQWFHQADWPRQGKDRFLIMGVEGRPGPLLIFDSTKWSSGTLRLRDRYTLPEDPAESSHWFDTHPRFEDGGLVAVAWNRSGTRIFEVTPRGQLEEVGFFTLPGANAQSAYWVSDDIVYAIDLYRGIDILRVTKG